tara:strand:+ start:2817 stop:3044 length:228 start_codon:yes stop_codon:yes gene_type:complete
MKDYLIDVCFRNPDGLEQTCTVRIKDADSQEQAEAMAKLRVSSQVNDRKPNSNAEVTPIEITSVACNYEDDAEKS